MPHRGALDHFHECDHMLARVKVPREDRESYRLLKNARARLQAGVLLIAHADDLRPAREPTAVEEELRARVAELERALAATLARGTS